MHHSFKEAIIKNDLDSLRMRIEDLPAHVEFTNALNFVTQAMDAIKKGSGDLHQSEMTARHAKSGA